MVMTSTEIAALNAGFQQQTMAGMQHAGMISQYAATRDPSQGADQLAGNIVNRTAAIGAPMAGLGMMLAGVDPISMGIKGGMGAAAMGASGFGIGAAALGGAAAVGVPMMAAQYAGGQMMTGMQQQQMLQSTMRQYYREPNMYGQLGPTRGQVGDMGASMRMMSQQRGPGGEFTSMEELGRLAANMGRMGLDQGVRNAKDFNEQFQKMLKAVKQVATDLGTSLEQAQQTMASMRAAGVLERGGQVRMAAQMRQGALAGGIATSEIAGMAMVGSQISRMIGGRGAAGAEAGASLMTDIGAAQRVGALSEEQIYNATGLTGAEGRRALATGMMQNTARFLKGGLGRRFLASVAGENGQVNQEDIDEYLAGGVGTGRTMQMAARNLGRVGRAGFIRNEGRYRGEAMRALRGQGSALVLRSWMNQRGMNVDDMDDRSMIWMKRRTGMDYEQLEAAMSLLRNQTRISMRREMSAEQDQNVQRLNRQRQQRGVQGVKRQVEDFRAKVQGTLQQMGADLYEGASELTEAFINKLTDNYVTSMNRDVTEIARELRVGGAAARQGALGELGVGPQGGILGFKRGATLGVGTTGQMGMRQLYGEGLTGGYAGVQARNQRVFSDVDRAGFAGSDIDTGSMASVRKGLLEYNQVQDSFFTERHQSARDLGKKYELEFKAAIGSREIRGQRMNRVRSFQWWLSEKAKTDKDAAALYSQIQGGGIEGKKRAAAIYGELARGANAGAEAQFMGTPTLEGIYGGGAFLTTGQRERAVGGAFLQGRQLRETVVEAETRGRVEDVAGALGGAAGTVAEIAGFGLVSAREGKEFGQRVADWLTPTVAKVAGVEGAVGITGRDRAAVGRFMEGERGQEMMRAMLSEDHAVRRAAMGQAATRFMELGQRMEKAGLGGLTQEERTQYLATQGMLAGSQYAEMLSEYGVTSLDQLSEADREIAEGRLKEIATRWGMGDPKAVVNAHATMGASLTRAQYEKRKAYFGQEGRRARGLMTVLKTSGVVNEYGVPQGELSEKLKGVKGQRGAELAGRFLKGMFGATAARGQMTGLSPQQDLQALMTAEQDTGSAMQALQQMTVAQQRQMAEQLKGVPGAQDVRKQVLRQTAATQRIEKARGGRWGQVKAMLGVAGVSAQDLKEAGLTKEKWSKMNAEEEVRALAAAAGIDPTDEKAMGSLREGVMSLRQGGQAGRGAAATAGLDLAAMGASKEAQEKRDAQNRAAQQNDPSYRALVDIKGAIENLPGNIAAAMPVQGEGAEPSNPPGAHGTRTTGP